MIPDQVSVQFRVIVTVAYSLELALKAGREGMLFIIYIGLV